MTEEAFCVRCRKKVEIQEERNVKYKNGRYAVMGLCPECGGKVCKTVKKKSGFLSFLLPSFKS